MKKRVCRLFRLMKESPESFLPRPPNRCKINKILKYGECNDDVSWDVSHDVKTVSLVEYKRGSTILEV